jgi:predicted nucleotidyltransferase
VTNKEYSRAATFDDLKKIISALNECGANYILIGGYALFSHGYHRATEDVDLLIPADTENAKAVIKALMVLEDQESANLPLEWFDGEENIRLADEVVVDLMFKTCGETYETLLPYVEYIDIDGIPMQTLTLEGLLLTKQSDRPKDQLDKSVLEQALEYIKSHKHSGPSF